MIQKYHLYVLTILVISTVTQLSAQIQAFPPHWFKDLHNQELEIMLYSPHGFESLPECKTDNLKAKASFATNHDYAYLKVDLSEFEGNSFKRDAVLREHYYYKGKYEDSHILSILKSEYQNNI